MARKSITWIDCNSGDIRRTALRIGDLKSSFSFVVQFAVADAEPANSFPYFAHSVLSVSPHYAGVMSFSCRSLRPLPNSRSPNIVRTAALFTPLAARFECGMRIGSEVLNEFISSTMAISCSSSAMLPSSVAVKRRYKRATERSRTDAGPSLPAGVEATGSVNTDTTHPHALQFQSCRTDGVT